MRLDHAFNQPPPLEDLNVFRVDSALQDALQAFAPAAALLDVDAVGSLAGSAQAIELGFDANRFTPELKTHDRFGRRIDEVRFHPAYHHLMQAATQHGLHAAPWADEEPGAHARRAAKFYLWSQLESGHGCPISMTYAAIPALRVQPDVASQWFEKACAREYDPQLAPIAKKRSAIFGMGMTEKQGGSDVRANITRAVPAGAVGPGNEYLLTGHKWFCSAPMSDAFLILAQAPAGLSCFFVPRVLPDGERNVFRIVRLKDKLGNRSNASGEVEFERTRGWLMGDEGRGVQAIVEMVNHTRLDCIIGSTALMRQATAQAVHHACYRQTFGKSLADHPLMQNVLADLALETEAAIALFVRLACAVDAPAGDRREAALKRIGTAIGKYYVCKRTPVVVGEALECLGGNGYVEESIMPRLYRESPLNSIWEGSGNINALDVLRIIVKQPEALDALRDEIAPAASDARVAAAMRDLERDLANEPGESQARHVVERLAVLWQAALLRRCAPDDVFESFVASRIAGRWGRTLGTLDAVLPMRAIVDRAAPVERREVSRGV